MKPQTRLFGVAAAVLAAGFALLPTAAGVPVPTEPPKGDVVKDRADYVPHRKQQKIPGKIVAVLLTDAQPVLTLEGRSGPADQLCIGYNGGSYRWVYTPVKEKPTIGTLQIPVADGSTRPFPNLSLASPATVKQWGIDTPYSLVEVEVNDGLGSPPGDSFVATKMKPLDGTKEYPIKVAAVIADLRKKYESHLAAEAKVLDGAMEDAARKAIKDRKPTGPRERSTLMFVTWMPQTERLEVRFRTRITDGAYQYGGGVRIDTGVARPGPGGVPPRLPMGLRYGTQFGVEYGIAYEVTKAGKLDRVRKLEAESFRNEIPMPPAFRDRRNPPVLPLPPNKGPAKLPPPPAKPAD